MAYLVIARPELRQSDYDWIQDYRRQNDKRYFDVIEPHFTFVFGIDELNRDTFLNEVRQKVSGTRPFDFELKVATINLDDSGNYYHEFLVPDKGYSAIVKLHDKLYSGLFMPYLRFDIDYIPHIGIGTSEDPQVSKKRIDELNARGVSITGRVNSLDVIEYTDGAVTGIEKITLLGR